MNTKDIAKRKQENENKKRGKKEMQGTQLGATGRMLPTHIAAISTAGGRTTQEDIAAIGKTRGITSQEGTTAKSPTGRMSS